MYMLILNKNGTGKSDTGNNGTNGKVSKNGILMLIFSKPPSPNPPPFQTSNPIPNPNIENVALLPTFICASFTRHHVCQYWLVQPTGQPAFKPTNQPARGQ